jgi:hypothetical protein
MADMSIEEILSNDLKNNYPEGYATVEEYAAGLEDAINNGMKIIRSGDALLIYDDVAEGVAEAHVINGGVSVIKGIQYLFKALMQLREDGYKEVQIPYDKKEFAGILSKLPIFQVTTEKIDDGEGRTYLTKVRLA